MSALLTIGGIHKIFNRTDAKNPIFQVLTIKHIRSSDRDNFILKLSDGTHFSSSCIVGTQLNIIAGTLTPKSRIRVNRYTCKYSNENKKIVIILDMDVLELGRENSDILGNPRRYEEFLQQEVFGNIPSNDLQVPTDISTWEFDRSGISGNIASNSQQARASRHFNNRSLQDFSQPGTSGVNQSSLYSGRSSGASESVLPISNLTPHKNIWTILARVTNKSNIIRYKNFNGGVRFFFDLCDATGEIRATAFNEYCNKFYHMIEVKKAYYITSSKVQMGNKKYNPMNNDYEIILNYETQVRLCEAETNIPCRRFTFVDIDKLETIELGKLIDIIGICKEIADVSTVNQRETGKELKKRDIQIADHSGKEVRLTLWEPHAVDFNGSLNAVIAVKGANVVDFGGRSLSVSSSSILLVNPDIEEAQNLRTWYETVGHNLQIENFPIRGNGRGMNSNLKMIGETLALVENLGYSERAYYFVKATIAYLSRDCLYKACPSKRCNKKVIDMNNGVYLCPKCNNQYDSFNWRYMLKLNIADGTDSVWVILFQDQAESLLGYSSFDFQTLREHDENAFHATLDSVLFREHIFKLLFKIESYKDEKNLQTIVESVQPLNYKDYNKVLLTQLTCMAT